MLKRITKGTREMNANDKSWSNETIALFDKLETQIRQQQAEIKRLEEQLSIAYEENDNYWIEKGKEK